jgi:methyl-accepting chemotaxis protein
MRLNRNKTIAGCVSLWSAALTLWLTYKTSLLEQVHDIRSTVERIQPLMVTMSDTLTVIGRNLDKSIVQDVKSFQEVNKRFDSVDTQVKDISSVCDNIATQEDIKKTMENIDKLFASMQLLQQIADKLNVEAPK